MISLEYKPDLKMQLADVFYQKAIDLVGQEKLASSYESLGESVRLFRDENRIKYVSTRYYDKGAGIMKRGQKAKGILFFEKATELCADCYKKDADSLFYLGEYFRSKGETAKAINFYSTVAEQYGNTVLGKKAKELQKEELQRQKQKEKRLAKQRADSEPSKYKAKECFMFSAKGQVWFPQASWKVGEKITIIVSYNPVLYAPNRTLRPGRYDEKWLSGEVPIFEGANNKRAHVCVFKY